MTSVLRILLTVALALAGVLFALLTVVKAKNGASTLALVQPAAAVGVAVWLIRQMWHDKLARPAGARSSSSQHSTKLIAVGLAIGVGAPLLLTWLLT